MVENTVEYNISTHAKQRYAERIMGKEDIDINRFVTLNEDKIKTDINKLISYGDLIYTGKQNKGNVVDVYIKDCWVIIADNKAKNVITIFKIDLGLDDEFNKFLKYSSDYVISIIAIIITSPRISVYKH